MKNNLKKLIGLAVFGYVGLQSCKPPETESEVKDLGRGQITGVGVVKMNVVLGYGGLTVKGRNQSFRFEGGNQEVPGTNIAVFDGTGRQIADVKILRLEILESHGTARVQNGMAALDMGTKQVPKYSMDLEFGDLYCSSLDKTATLVFGVMGEVACFRKSTAQGEFVKHCLRPGALGHVEINGANPICISKVPPVIDSRAYAGAKVGARQKTGDPLLLDYIYPQHREMVKYLSTYRQLQNICDNPGFPAGTLTSTGTSSNTSVTSAGGNSLGYCQCRSTGGGNSQSYSLMSEARRIHRNLLLWKGKTPSRDPLLSFQQACQDGTAINLPLPANLSGADADMIKNEQICGQLQNAGRATLGEDRCLCKVNSSYSDRYGSGNSQNNNISVNFRMGTEQFTSQCLRIASETTTNQYCDSSTELSFIKESSPAEGATARDGCSGCPAVGYGKYLYRNNGEGVITYALRCMGVR